MPKILAIDYGGKRVGLATAISELNVALPFGIIENNGAKKLIADIVALCRKEGIAQIVVGLPMGLGGTKTKQTEKTEKFIAALKKKAGMPIETQSEAFTSREAHGIFKDAGVKKRHIDESATTLILVDYLERIDK